MTELTATQARCETIEALGKAKEARKEYEHVLDLILETAKSGGVSVDVNNLGLYSILCLKRDGFSIERWDREYTIIWDNNYLK